MPPPAQLNKDFWKALFKDDKRAFKVHEINHIIVPKLDELSVEKMIELMKDDEEVRAYLPEGYFKKVKPDRTFLFNILNTVHPGYLPTVIDGASGLRDVEFEEKEEKETILATD